MVCLQEYKSNFVFSPHHGRSVADSFGGEWRKALNNEILTTNIISYSDLLSTMNKAFDCDNTLPGSKRVSILRYFCFCKKYLNQLRKDTIS
jgi:hypothetical protein